MRSPGCLRSPSKAISMELTVASLRMREGRLGVLVWRQEGIWTQRLVSCSRQRASLKSPKPESWRELGYKKGGGQPQPENWLPSQRSVGVLSSKTKDLVLDTSSVTACLFQPKASFQLFLRSCLKMSWWPSLLKMVKQLQGDGPGV